MTLIDLKPGQSARIHQISHHQDNLANKVISLGLFPGESVEILRQAPLGDPLQVKVGSTLVSVRKQDAQMVSVVVEEVQHG